MTTSLSTLAQEVPCVQVHKSIHLLLASGCCLPPCIQSTSAFSALLKTNFLYTVGESLCAFYLYLTPLPRSHLLFGLLLSLLLMWFPFTHDTLLLRKDCKHLAPHRRLSDDFQIKDTSKGLYQTDLTEKGGFDPFYAHKRTLTIDMGPDALALLGADEEEQEEPVFTKAYVLRLVTSLLLLLAVLMVGSSAGYLPPKGSIVVDTRIKWSIRGVPKEMRESGLVPWWKVALVSVNVDVDVVAGKRKSGGDKEKVLGATRQWGLEGGEWEQGHLEGRNEDLAAVKDFGRGQAALMDRHPRLHRML